jgi:hypothetical protein
VLLTTAIIFFTQSLALGRQISQPQTLTALADNAVAWGGLGPSWMTLWDNIRIPAALISTLIICSYFATLALLQMTTPILFSLVLTNVSSDQILFTVVGTPLLYNATGLTESLPPNWELLGPERTEPDWYAASSVANLLGSSISLSPPGLKDNRIYDTLITTLPNNGTTVVNYTDFNVSCGTTPQPNFTWVADPLEELVPGYFFLPVSFWVATTINNTVYNITDRVWYNVNSTDPATNYWVPSGKHT